MTEGKLEEFQTTEVLENVIVELRSAPNMGIKLQGESFWRNFSSKASDKEKETIRAKLAQLPFGSTINISVMGERIFTDFSVVKVPEKEKKAFGEDRDIVELKELLNAAHKKNVKSITTEIVHIDYEKGQEMAHIRAVVIDKEGNQYTSSACKTRSQMHEQQQGYWYEIIESQAIARALRWFTNTGDVSDVEVEGKKED